MKKWTALVAAALAFGAASASLAQGVQDWPARPIRVITPFPAGGINDIVMRVVAEKLSTAWSQPIVIEQKLGADGNIGTDAVAKSAPDGYTWLASSFPLTVAPALHAALPFDPIKDFRAAALTATAPNVLVVAPQMPVNSLGDFIAYAKAHPGKVFYAIPANGSSAHIGTEVFKRLAGFEATQVLYKGAPPALLDVIAGRVQFMLVSSTLAAQQIKAGKLKALAMISPQRSALLPGVPTIGEAGYAAALVVPWFGVHVPAGTPEPVVQKINQAITIALASPDVRSRLENAGLTPAEPRTPKEIDASLREEVLRWRQLAKQIDLSSQ